MKAAILHGQMDLRYEERALPSIGSGEILAKVKISGICGSDLPRVLGNAAHSYPIVLGHEFSGEVTELGSGVKNISVGQHIVGAPLLPCHHCEDCLRGYYSQCKNYSFIGSRTDGSWAEYVKMPAVNAVPLPEGVGDKEGAFFEPATVALHGLSQMNFRGGEDVAIVGMGTIGLLTLQCAHALGAKRIFAFDIDSRKLQLAKELGADVVLNTGAEDFAERYAWETKGAGVYQVIETAGVEFTEKLCLEIAANKGQVMYIGTPTRSVSFEPREFERINRKELTVRGSWMSYSAPFPGQEWRLAGHFFQKGKIQCQGLIDRIVPLSEINAAFRDLQIPGEVKGKILLRCS
ncbi:Alcohol dehydrogenase GroES-like domain protein [Acididesulfobacillus acetoxydans]|uniref:Alcohol dehydrogenase GroES-like domain protein n=1 Tax=Acididesulfobacillus acetoxydans TaxID=1561005 RepID=A0A8S0Y2J9_9FIRM|nr:galactitol-1-phosphate 5-dehydrogenase [Acididesulfobacillus acetoxydans]CAA7600915.1 Alcohol dehydrogenase GroES-like domain protein [Acididesulfobacillus acetoxydans]CEJ08928.1 Galactitol-1-phosphate 5-dehydrogenase [Acididesulfobacillus acetoxydans]